MKKKLRIGVFFTIFPPLFNKCCKDCLLFVGKFKFSWHFCISRKPFIIHAQRDTDMAMKSKKSKPEDFFNKWKGDLIQVWER